MLDLSPLSDVDCATEISVVMPCLNEAETLGVCIQKAFEAFSQAGLSGEIIIADNGSTDGSQELATSLGARVICVEERGYGNALRSGIEVALGRYVLFADSDDSYDFRDIPRFVAELHSGADLVMGNRFQGGIMPGAMPRLHRYIGNPLLSGIGRLLFRCPVGDFHCGMRAFTKIAFEKMELTTTGMEFASEMVIKASLKKLRIVEIPTKLHPDGRSRPPHLRTWRDGWRNLRFMLLFSPRWLFFLPGILFFLLGGILVLLLSFSSVQVYEINLDIHTLLVGSTLCIIGHQLIIFGLFSKGFAIREGLHPPSRPLERWGTRVTLEVGVLAGVAFILVGALLLGAAVYHWEQTGFGDLDPSRSMRLVIPAMLLLTLGVQTCFGSFFLGVLSVPKTKETNAIPHDVQGIRQ